MLGVGQRFPAFSLKAVVSSDMASAFKDVTEESAKGQWLVMFFWPKDFTFVCPTEIVEFNNLLFEFQKRQALLLGVSIDSEFVHLAWRQQYKPFQDLKIPMLSDLKRELVTKLDIMDPKEGVAQRATYIVDPEGIIRFVMVTDLQVGRNVHEVLRVLDALQTGELVPCNWEKGQETLKAA
jgi:peroxiredoxin (alkyl hydroperoxide reductase subunit C)